MLVGLGWVMRNWSGVVEGVRRVLGAGQREGIKAERRGNKLEQKSGTKAEQKRIRCNKVQ